MGAGLMAARRDRGGSPRPTRLATGGSTVYAFSVRSYVRKDARDLAVHLPRLRCPQPDSEERAAGCVRVLRRRGGGIEKENRMTCDQCGASTQVNTGFCPSCGATTQASTRGDWNGTPGLQEVPLASTSPVNATTATQTLVPICSRRGAFRSSLPWVVLLAACVTGGTAVQLSRRVPLSVAAQVQSQPGVSEQNTAGSTPAMPLPRVRIRRPHKSLRQTHQLIATLRKRRAPKVE